MAKQIAGPVERHIEKAVVALAGLFLVGVIALYLVGSPNKLELGGAETVTPSTVDARVVATAEAVRDRIKSARPKIEIPPPIFPDFVARLDPFTGSNLGQPLPRAVALGPPVPIIDRAEVIEGDARLVEVIPLPRPTVVSGRSTFKVPTGAGTSFVPENWATVSVLFDRRTQAQRQGLAYGDTRSEVIFGPVQLQRRALRPDGSWSDEDWEMVDSWPAETIPAVPDIPLVQEKKTQVVPQDDYNKVVKFRDTIREPVKQLGLIRPLMPPVANGTPRTFPMLTSCKDVLLQDDEYLSPAAPAAALADRYGCLEQQPDKTAAAAAPKSNPVAELFKAGQKLLDEATTKEECVLAFNKFAEIDQTPGASAGDKAKAQKLMEQASQKERNIERQIRLGGPTTGPVDKPSSVKPRERQPHQQLWAHDARANSVLAGKTYQYRMRVQLYNRLAGEPLFFREKSESQVVFIPGAWSEPTEPITIPAVERFFVTAADSKKEDVSVELYRWFEGVWVKTRERFTVGKSLAYKDKVTVPSLDNPEVPDRPEVAFSADATIVDIDFKRNYREQKKGTAKSGVKYPTVEAGAAVVFVDSAGNLQERFVAADKGRPDKPAVYIPPKTGK